MFCRNCGEKLKDNAKYCTNCGTEISSNNKKQTVNTVEEKNLDNSNENIFESDEIITDFPDNKAEIIEMNAESVNDFSQNIDDLKDKVIEIVNDFGDYVSNKFILASEINDKAVKYIEYTIHEEITRENLIGYIDWTTNKNGKYGGVYFTNDALYIKENVFLKTTCIKYRDITGVFYKDGVLGENITVLYGQKSKYSFTNSAVIRLGVFGAELSKIHYLFENENEKSSNPVGLGSGWTYWPQKNIEKSADELYGKYKDEIVKSKEEEKKRESNKLVQELWQEVQYIGGHPEIAKESDCKISLYTQGIKLDVGILMISNAFINYEDIKKIYYERASEMQSRITLTRLVLLGPLGLFLRKHEAKNRYFLTIECNDYSVIFSHENAASLQKVYKRIFNELNEFRSRNNNNNKIDDVESPKEEKTNDFEAFEKLKKLKELYDLGILTENEYVEKKNKIVSEEL